MSRPDPESIVQQSPTLQDAEFAGMKKGAKTDAEATRNYRASRDYIVAALLELRAYFLQEQGKAGKCLSALLLILDLMAIPTGSAISNPTQVCSSRQTLHSTRTKAHSSSKALRSAKFSVKCSSYLLFSIVLRLSTATHN